jgi:transposase InsO family protein
MIVASLNGYLYYVLFIDDHSRKTWIYFLKTKDGVLARFQEFKAQVENLTGRKIKVLRSDNGGEYTSKDFNNFCIEAGIKREYTVPYNPQQNGVAERKNRTIIEATKAMIHDQSLPMILWAEAFDRPFSTGGQLMCHEEMHHQMPILLKTFGSTGLCLAQHLFLYLEFPHPCVG